MKGYVLKNRPFKYLLMLCCETTNKKVPFETVYRGFHTKKEALNFYDTYSDSYNCIYACLYKKTALFVEAVGKAFNFLNGLLVNDW